jgi:hypothetical protein
MPLVVLLDYPGTREYLHECCSQWHYSSQATDQIYLKRALGNLGRSIHRCCLMHYHSKGYQQGLQGWPTDVHLRTTCISCVYESLNRVYVHNDRSLWLKDARIRLYPEKKFNPQFSAKESALIPLVIFQI